MLYLPTQLWGKPCPLQVPLGRLYREHELMSEVWLQVPPGNLEEVDVQ